MNRTYWNKVADSYEAEIFSVRKHDRTGQILGKLKKYGGKNRKASDVGCGIGHFLPILSDLFLEVLALDISSKCIAKARRACAHRPNISYRTVDLAAPRVRLPKVDFALCVNSVITPSIAHRNRMLDVVCRHLRPGSHLVMVVPSLESEFLTDFRLIEWNLRDGMTPGRAVRSGFRAHRPSNKPRAYEGVVQIDQVDTKHYLKEELVVLLENRGLRILEIEKIEYPWTTEFTTPPRWMQAPHPWDWLVVARKSNGDKKPPH